MRSRRTKVEAWSSLPGEEWRAVVGFETAYRVSSLGRVLSLARICSTGIAQGWRTVPERILNGTVQLRPDGVPYARTVTLRTHPDVSRPKSYAVSRLVAEAFIGPRPSEEHVASHRNGDPVDCTRENVYWDTYAHISSSRGIRPTEQAIAALRLACAARKTRQILKPEREGA